MKNLERYTSAGGVSRKKNPGVSPPADLLLDLVPSGERLAHQGKHVAPNVPILKGSFNG